VAASPRGRSGQSTISRERKWGQADRSQNHIQLSPNKAHQNGNGEKTPKNRFNKKPSPSASYRALGPGGASPAQEGSSERAFPQQLLGRTIINELSHKSAMRDDAKEKHRGGKKLNHRRSNPQGTKSYPQKPGGKQGTGEKKNASSKHRQKKKGSHLTQKNLWADSRISRALSPNPENGRSPVARCTCLKSKTEGKK